MTQVFRRVLDALAVVAVVLTLVTADATPVASPVAGGRVHIAWKSPRIVEVQGLVDAKRRRRIGRSVQGRRLFAYRVGNSHAKVKALVLGNMHGNESAGVRLVNAIRSGPLVKGVDLWVVPTINPDGLAAHTRQNARGVDLNRNWRYKWVRQTGQYNSGPRPFSEPETRALKRFVGQLRPRFIVSFHQPLHGVDSDQVKNRHLMNRLAANLGLSKIPMRCNGTCHGTMTGWYNHRRAGAAITVEFGPHPPRGYLTGRAARGTVRALLGHF